LAIATGAPEEHRSGLLREQRAARRTGNPPIPVRAQHADAERHRLGLQPRRPRKRCVERDAHLGVFAPQFGECVLEHAAGLERPEHLHIGGRELERQPGAFCDVTGGRTRLAQVIDRASVVRACLRGPEFA
jgi:hypothetical protein